MHVSLVLWHSMMLLVFLKKENIYKASISLISLIRRLRNSPMQRTGCKYLSSHENQSGGKSTYV